MTPDVYREVVKALAYGKSTAEICSIMGVSEKDVNSIPRVAIDCKREELKGKGYIR